MTDIAPSPNFMKGVYYLSLNTGRTLPGVVLMVDVTKPLGMATLR